MQFQTATSMTVLAAIVFALSAGSAHADAIDGQWCREARSLTIQGPNIVTAGGTSLQGNYSRHAFTYVAPQSEPEAGGTVEMDLLSDDEMRLRQHPAASGAPGDWELWRRCEVTS